MLSVIVPVYNAEKYLPRCVESILTQSFTDIEVLLINDGSTDGSGLICDEYALKDVRVRVFHKKNGGVSSTRNMGLEVARGEWIAFVDADDWIEPYTFEKAHKLAVKENADICCFRFKVLYPDRQVLIDIPQITGEKEECINNWIRFGHTSLWCMIVNKELYDKYSLRCPVQNYCEDFYLTVRLMYYAKKIAVVNEYGYNYNRLNENSILNNLSCLAGEEELIIYKETIDFFSSNHVLNYFEEAMAWRVLKCSQNMILNSSRHKDFRKVFPIKYARYISSCPTNFVNIKVKIMAWMLCYNIVTPVRYINKLRTIYKSFVNK